MIFLFAITVLLKKQITLHIVLSPCILIQYNVLS